MTNKYILLTGIIALLVSCSRSLTDLGYSSRAINTNVHTENNFYRYSQTAVPDMHNPGPGYVTRDKSYATYNIIADEDLENLFLVSVKIRMAALQKFYSDLKTGTFSKARFNKEYASLCSPAIKQRASSFATRNSDDGVLGGWQIFKPYPGLDSEDAQYKIAYESNDWFSVTPVGDSEYVRLKVVLTGRSMNPVIVEIDNPSFGIKTQFSDYQNIGKGYNFPYEKALSANNTYQRSRNYYYWLTETLTHTSSVKGDNCLTDSTIIGFYKKSIIDREVLMTSFYDNLNSSDFNKKAFSKKYGSWIYYDVDKNIRASKIYDKKSDFGLWNAFRSANKDVSISYEGNNWFCISGKEQSDSVHVQLVACKNKMRPMIIGLKNNTANINIGEDLNTIRKDITGWPWIVRP